MEDNRRNSHGSVDRRPPVRVRFRVQVGRDDFYYGYHFPSTSIRDFIIKIQKTVRSNGHVGEDDYIVSLELRNDDDGEPEQLVLDSTLEDVLVRRGDKKLVAVVKSINTAPAALIDQGRASPNGTGDGSGGAQAAQPPRGDVVAGDDNSAFANSREPPVRRSSDHLNSRAKKLFSSPSASSSPVARENSSHPDEGATDIAIAQAPNENTDRHPVVTNFSPETGTVPTIHESGDQSARTPSGDAAAAVAPSTGVHSKRSSERTKDILRALLSTKKSTPICKVSRRRFGDPGSAKGAIPIANTQALDAAIPWPPVEANSSPEAGTVLRLHEIHDQSTRAPSGNVTAAVAPSNGVDVQRSDDQIETVTREQQSTNKASDGIPSQPNAGVLRTRLVPRGHYRDSDSEVGASAQAPEVDNHRHPVAANSLPEAVPASSIHESARGPSGNVTAAVAPTNSVDRELSDDQIESETSEQQRTNRPVSPFHLVTRFRSRNPSSDKGTGPNDPAAPQIDEETHPYLVEANTDFNAATEKLRDCIVEEVLDEYIENVPENAIAAEWPSNKGGVDTSNANDRIASREQQGTNNVRSHVSPEPGSEDAPKTPRASSSQLEETSGRKRKLAWPYRKPVASFADVPDYMKQVRAQIALGKRPKAPSQQAKSVEQANEDSSLRRGALAREKRTKTTRSSGATPAERTNTAANELVRDTIVEESGGERSEPVSRKRQSIGTGETAGTKKFSTGENEGRVAVSAKHSFVKESSGKKSLPEPHAPELQSTCIEETAGIKKPFRGENKGRVAELPVLKLSAETSAKRSMPMIKNPLLVEETARNKPLDKSARGEEEGVAVPVVENSDEGGAKRFKGELTSAQPAAVKTSGIEPLDKSGRGEKVGINRGPLVDRSGDRSVKLSKGELTSNQSAAVRTAGIESLAKSPKDGLITVPAIKHSGDGGATRSRGELTSAQPAAVKTAGVEPLDKSVRGENEGLTTGPVVDRSGDRGAKRSKGELTSAQPAALTGSEITSILEFAKATERSAERSKGELKMPHFAAIMTAGSEPLEKSAKEGLVQVPVVERCADRRAEISKGKLKIDPLMKEKAGIKPLEKFVDGKKEENDVVELMHRNAGRYRSKRGHKKAFPTAVKTNDSSESEGSD